MTRIGQAVMLLHAGDREEARNRLGALWAELGSDGDPLHRCTLAHYMADAQDDPGDELAWDLRALTAAEAVRHIGGPGESGAEGAAEHRHLLPSARSPPRSTSTSRRTTSSSTATTRPGPTSGWPARRPPSSRTTDRGARSAPPSTAWSSASGSGDPGGPRTALPPGPAAAVAPGPERQRPYASEQIRDCGLPAGHLPYPRPSAQTSAPPGRRGTAGATTGGAARGCGVGCRGGSARSAGGAASAGPERRGGPASGAGGAGEDARAGDGLGPGTASSASRAGGCTTCGATSCTGPAVPGRGGGNGSGLHRHAAGDGGDRQAYQERRGDSGSLHAATLRPAPLSRAPVCREWPARVTRSARLPGPYTPGSTPPRRAVAAAPDLRVPHHHAPGQGFCRRGGRWATGGDVCCRGAAGQPRTVERHGDRETS